jgi:hypothetical protein
MNTYEKTGGRVENDPAKIIDVLLGETQAPDEALPLCPTLAVTFCNGLFFIVLGLCYMAFDNTELSRRISG